MAFEERAVKQTMLADDLPNAAEAARSHPDGAVYVSDSKNVAFRGKRYVLRHARWVGKVTRKRTKASPATGK